MLQEDALHIIQKHKTNKCAWQPINILAGRHEILLSAVKRHKLSWFSHICVTIRCRKKFILQGTEDNNRLQ